MKLNEINIKVYYCLKIKYFNKNYWQSIVEVFIRPMHGEENWDRTIEHEQGSNKTYYVLDDVEDFEDFLAD